MLTPNTKPTLSADSSSASKDKIDKKSRVTNISTLLFCTFFAAIVILFSFFPLPTLIGVAALIGITIITALLYFIYNSFSKKEKTNNNHDISPEISQAAVMENMKSPRYYAAPNTLSTKFEETRENLEENGRRLERNGRRLDRLERIVSAITRNQN